MTRREVSWTPVSPTPAAELLTTAGRIVEDTRVLEQLAEELRAENAALRRDRDGLLALLTTVTRRLPEPRPPRGRPPGPPPPRARPEDPRVSEDVSLNGLILDRAAGRALAGGHVIPLSPREFELLAHLLDRRGRAVSKEALRRAVWPGAGGDDLRTVRVHVSGLRTKLEGFVGLPVRITTVHRVGYRLDVVDEPG
ncbi:MAG TPA: winged helix-turn-helix domain-containing protein [Candidatus Dormibacteraeota bacterium]